MKIYTKDAESSLYEMARNLSEDHKAWRSIYFNFSEINEAYKEGLRTNLVVNIIKDLLADEEGYVYLCRDSDVIILFQGSVQRILNKLGEYISSAVPMADKNSRDEFCAIYDLSKSWNVFYAICKSKAENIEEPEKKPEQKAKPAMRKMELAKETFDKSAADRKTREKLLALVVEDDPFTRRLVANSLRPQVEVLEAGDGATALELYALHAPDIAFLDIELPDTNGHIILKKLAAADLAGFIVMLSGNSFKENIIAALEDGAQGFVTKPFAREKLYHYISKCKSGKA